MIAPAVEDIHAAAVEMQDAYITAMRAAMLKRGYRLLIVTDEAGVTEYAVSRWSMHTTLRDMDAVREFAARAGVTV